MRCTNISLRWAPAHPDKDNTRTVSQTATLRLGCALAHGGTLIRAKIRQAGIQYGSGFDEAYQRTKQTTNNHHSELQLMLCRVQLSDSVPKWIAHYLPVCVCP
jgi:hypothetical protein